jgi:signal transduction histidine kinase
LKRERRALLLEREHLKALVDRAHARTRTINSSLEALVREANLDAPRSPEAQAATEKGVFEAVLRQTIARLEETNHRKDDFFAVLAHEMRTLLHATLSWTEVLRETDDPKTKEQALASIKRSMKLQARMIDDLLDVSKISTGKLFLELQELDLASVVGNAFEMVLPEATGKEIEMELVVERSSIPMCGDLAHLEQVVSNILSNAIKFTRKGGKVSVDVAVVGNRRKYVSWIREKESRPMSCRTSSSAIARGIVR